MFALNPNVLYLQATPMTEPLLLGLTTVAVALLMAWCGHDLTACVTAGQRSPSGVESVGSASRWERCVGLPVGGRSRSHALRATKPGR